MSDTIAGFFYLSAPIAGAVSGLISYGVDKDLDGKHGIRSWQWLFVIEGVITVGWGMLVLILLPRLPERVVKRGSWLFSGQEECNLIAQRTTQR
jgi:hypothetical protein